MNIADFNDFLEGKPPLSPHLSISCGAEGNGDNDDLFSIIDKLGDDHPDAVAESSSVVVDLPPNTKTTGGASDDDFIAKFAYLRRVFAGIIKLEKRMVDQLTPEMVQRLRLLDDRREELQRSAYELAEKGTPERTELGRSFAAFKAERKAVKEKAQAECRAEDIRRMQDALRDPSWQPEPGAFDWKGFSDPAAAYAALEPYAKAKGAECADAAQDAEIWNRHVEEGALPSAAIALLIRDARYKRSQRAKAKAMTPKPPPMLEIVSDARRDELRIWLDQQPAPVARQLKGRVDDLLMAAVAYLSCMQAHGPKVRPRHFKDELAKIEGAAELVAGSDDAIDRYVHRMKQLHGEGGPWERAARDVASRHDHFAKQLEAEKAAKPKPARAKPVSYDPIRFAKRVTHVHGQQENARRKLETWTAAEPNEEGQAWARAHASAIMAAWTALGKCDQGASREALLKEFEKRLKQDQTALAVLRVLKPPAWLDMLEQLYGEGGPWADMPADALKRAA
ncbi:hypothetical protein [Azospirillum sp. SYSU D00513]|uniref:hypothetical protein n=1 Tax=Azospirillum sp. SYSU D00513 TaxID=2812561 RepID=UPI001A964B8C|nr:hypothetical protein [Azospirillum sp. SYSU D00513]